MLFIAVNMIISGQVLTIWQNLGDKAGTAVVRTSEPSSLGAQALPLSSEDVSVMVCHA